ncbi:MAG: response regulator [Bacteroidia bacterium]
MGVFAQEAYSGILNFTRVYYELSDQLSTEFRSRRQMKTKKSFSILLADDDDDDREFLRETISEIAPKSTIHAVGDGASLMDHMNSFETTLPDIIFLDLNMPFKDGKECLSELKGSGKFQHIPVIIYSTSSYIKDIENAYNNGANLYVIKPSTCNELKKIIRKVFATDWSESVWAPRREKFIMR